MPGEVNWLILASWLGIVSLVFADDAHVEDATRFVIDFKDGSSVIAVPSLSHIPVKTSASETRIALGDILELQSRDEDGEVSIRLRDGKDVSGVLHLDNGVIELSTILGDVSVEVDQVKGMKFLPCMSLPPSLRADVSAYYSFDGHADDLSGRKRHGIVHGATPGEDRFGRPGRCYLIKGKDFIGLDRKAVHKLAQFSICSWIFFDTLNRDGEYPANTIISVANQSTSEDLFFGQGVSGDDMRLNLKGEHSGWRSFKDCHLDEGEWHHVALTRKREKAVLYFDGEPVGKTYVHPGALSAAVGGVVVGQEQDSIGGGFDANQTLNGKIDELCIFSRALSAEEVAAVFSWQKNAPETAPSQPRPAAEQKAEPEPVAGQ